MKTDEGDPLGIAPVQPRSTSWPARSSLDGTVPGLVAAQVRDDDPYRVDDHQLGIDRLEEHELEGQRPASARHFAAVHHAYQVEIRRRAVRGLADLPVIFISGYGRDETIARALEAGAEDYDRRPVTLTATEYELLRVLAQGAGRVLTHEALLRQVWAGRGKANPKIVRAYVGWEHCISSGHAHT